MEPIATRKAAARTAAFAARKAAHAEAAQKTPAATRALLQAIGPPQGLRIAGYLPIRTEIDPRPAMQALHAQGARLSVPVIAGEGQPLRFREWTPETPLVPGPFGAPVPETGAWITPQILIVPLVAFDGQARRLGYGGGFYDRTLEGLRAAAPTRAIGLAYAAQHQPHLPLEPTDQPLDLIVTETGPLVPSPAAP